jgi:ribA/ribD-fused uncharacterized protein
MIDCFDGEFAFLSNFYPSPISDGNLIFPTVEHMFQAAKTVNIEEYEEIAAADTPGRAKRLGRKVTLREDWEEVKDEMMYQALWLKFSIPELREKLLATGDKELIEGNTWHDNTWGDCSCDHCKDIKGKNKLGKLLMQIREEIKSSM